MALFFMRNNKKEPVNNLIKYSGLGIQMLVSIGVGAWLGLKLDQYLGLKFPLFLITFVFVIFGGLMYQLYRSLNKD